MFADKSEETNKNIKFHSLAPTDNAENSDIYLSALDWAIKEPNINNIAVTGNYGSGKSSILNTYQKKSKRKERFLNISLATFDQKDYKKDDNIIEKSILQQLFYKEKINKTPYSRFKKINNLNSKLWLKILATVLIVFSIIWIINPNIFSNIVNFITDKFSYNFIFFNNRLDSILNFIIKSTFTVVSIIAIIYILNILYKILVNISCRLTIKKNDIELEITPKDKQTKESIFNKYIDEIIYFFEVTKYDIVIFEDLDRLKNYSGLFVKLREMNTLLNNSKIIKKDKITFVYAVKDDVFTDDKERTKFFEFIIPVIPVINSNNSKDKLVEMIEDMPYKEELSNARFLDNITLYIDDMRLLNSVINEFNIYSQQINVKYDVKKLFSIILYKNLFPEDFSKLQNNDGILYEILNNKEENLKNILSDLQNRYNLLQAEIEKFNNEYNVKNIDDFKRIVWTYITQRYSGYSNYYINNARHSSIDSFLEDTSINTTEKLKNISVRVNGYNEQNITDIIPNIEGKIGYTKNELEEIINQKNEELNILGNKILKIKNKKISEIINEYGIKKYYSLPDNMTILTYLIKNGYIDESYREYINYFYPTTLKIEDKNFVLNVNNQTLTNYNYRLHNIKNIIGYFADEDFLKQEILNFDLLDYMLQNASKYDLKLNNLFKQLNNKDYGIDFIKEYIVTKKMSLAFIKYFVKYCSEMLDKLNQHLPNIYKEKLLNRILIYADLNDIEKYLGSNQKFIDRVNKCKYFCRIFKNHKMEKAREILDILNIKFEYIDTKEINSELFDTIYKQNCYIINQKNTELILNKKFNEKVETIHTQNYTIISKYEELHKYINSNINIYINDVFFKYESNVMEDIKSINEILSNEMLDIETKRKIIEKEQILNDIELINDKTISDEESSNEVTLWELYLEKNKVIPNFSNIIKYYNKYNLDDQLVSFINVNSEFLDFNNMLDTNLYDNFIKDIIENDKINDKGFECIVNAISSNYEFNEFDFSIINKERSSKILSNSKIDIKFDENNYNNLKNNYSELLIKFIEYDIKEFYKIMDNLDYDDVLISDIILSSKIERTVKIDILCKCNDEVQLKNISQKQNIIDFILRGRKCININYNIFKQLFDNTLDSTKLIDLLMFQDNILSNEQISECLLELKEPYSNIPKQEKIPKLEINSQNIKFKEFLEKRQFDYLGKITKTKDNRYYKINKKVKLL
ncbi:MAG: hypothetical protein HFJ60_03495 [Clostridia bacterium]|jgi:hypothetical protein|nr:hypothetical protein [Clostridia bacterium]